MNDLGLEADEYEGKGQTLDDAANDAWEKAKHAGQRPGWYRIKTMYVRTENPVKEYRVTIAPGG